ncbi:AraC family transcriptional regulator [Desulfofustis glycolicus]|uniref:Transcriptional regulator, AraC family n=1 Tax=Desulfofustis glycolicus DSM 9705 TaxID=1121409 RepID=A0A1M5YPR5_9BACT|nr:AraC family transcriptional regulator [Desulfofustis glycolicus]SHI13868.1 transcriptional regulator, AraC family [Desulfofustis glycolicus DSM 9705]
MTHLTRLLKYFPEMADGVLQSRLNGVLFFQETQHIARRPMVYNPGICIVAQGHKIGTLGDQTFRYDASNYLVTSVTMPFECETFASPEEPLRGLYIDIDMGQLHDLISRIDLPAEIEYAGEKSLPRGIGPATLDKEMLDATTKLVRCLRSEEESQILGPGLVREILYRALRGAQAPVLCSLATHSGTFSQIARALKIMQNDYAAKVDVEQLASTARMSASAFHRAFKEVTSDSPMQYLKKIRLTKARDLMVQEQVKAYIAADRVGYESSSQFSREFKRYFGQSPAEMVRELRTA